MAKTYKARYVAKGYSQIKDIDYHETFAPTSNFTSLRALMQIAAKHDLILHQINVKSAYVKMNQKMYLTKLLVRFEMSDCN